MKICFCHPVLNDYEPRIRAFFEVLTHSISLRTKVAAIQHEVEFVELTYTAATRSNVEGEIRDADIFVFAGHSDSEGAIIAGHGSEVCLDLCNAGLLAGKDVYLICCHAANCLAHAIIKHEGKGCIAFDDKVYLMARKQEPVVVRCLVEPILSLLDGVDPIAAWRRTFETHALWIGRILKQYSDDEQWLLAACALDWNIEHLNVVTKSKTRKGVSILPKLSNPSGLNYSKLEKGMDRMRAWVERLGTRADSPGIVTGGDDSYTPREILEILEQRIKEHDLGHDDAPERYLVQLTKTCQNETE